MVIYDVSWDWILVLGIVLGLSFLLSFLSEDKFELVNVLIYANLFSAFMVSANLMPLWIVALFIIILVAMMYAERRSTGGGI